MPGKQPDHLTALVRTIVFQQLSGKATATISVGRPDVWPADDVDMTGVGW